MVRHFRDDFRYCRAAYLPRHILSANLHGILASIFYMRVVDHDISALCQFSQGHSIPYIYAPLQRQPCERAIHRPGIKVEIAQFARQLLSNRTLPGPCRSINGDSRWPHVSSACSWLSILTRIISYDGDVRVAENYSEWLDRRSGPANPLI